MTAPVVAFPNRWRRRRRPPCDDPRLGHALLLRGLAMGRPALDGVEGEGRDEVRWYTFSVVLPGELTLRFIALIWPAQEGCPAWLDLMKADALVEVEVRTDDIGDLLCTGDGCLSDPGCTLIPQRVRVWLPEAGWK
jgi:hypothetical protein